VKGRKREGEGGEEKGRDCPLTPLVPPTF